MFKVKRLVASVYLFSKRVHMFLYNYSLNFVQQETRPSTSASSISPPKKLIGLWWEDLDPRRHIKPVYCLAIWLAVFFSNQGCNSLVDHVCSGTHTTRCREDQQRKWPVFYFSDSFVVCSSDSFVVCSSMLLVNQGWRHL